LLLLVVALAVLGSWGGSWLHDRLRYVHETDARVEADMISIPARQAGWLVRLDVEEGDRVTKGQKIGLIDRNAAALRLREMEAELGALQAERARVAAKRTMVDKETESRLAALSAGLKAARSLAAARVHEARLAGLEYARAKALKARGVASANELDRARAANQRANQDLLGARAQVMASQAKADEARAQRQELGVLDAELEVLRRREKQYGARVARQNLLLAQHSVVAPASGVISRTFVDAGEYVRVGQRVALLHDPHEVWIEANVRETEVARLKVGQRVQIRVDAYPDRPRQGRVERIGAATTGEFRLLPTPNPSGNFTKVTQRLPVRISVSGNKGELRPGMLVEIDVEVGKPRGR